MMAKRLQKRRFFYGRYITAAAMMASFAYSVRFNSVYGLFLTDISAVFDMSRTAVSGVQSLGRIVEAGVAPLVGPAMDKYGARRFLLIGSSIVLVGYLLTAISQNALQFYLFQAFIVSVGFGMAGQIATSHLMANWYVVKRGRMNGLVIMVSSLGQAGIPILVALTIMVAGQRMTWVIMGIAFWLFIAVPAALWVRGRPEDLGLRPDGKEPRRRSEAEGQAARNLQRDPELVNQDARWTRRQVLRNSSFWLLTATFGVAMLGIQGANLHLIPLIEDMGYSVSFAALAVGLRSILGMASSPLWGWLMDRYSFRYVVMVQFLLQATGLAAIGTAEALPQVLFGMIFFGVGLSGNLVAQSVVWPNYFGRNSQGTVRGLAMPIMLLFSAGGPVYMGFLFDLTGSYLLPFAILSALLAVASVMILFASPPKQISGSRNIIREKLESDD